MFADGVRTLDQLCELTHVSANTRETTESLFVNDFIALKPKPHPALERDGFPQKNPYSNVSAFKPLFNRVQAAVQRQLIDKLQHWRAFPRTYLPNAALDKGFQLLSQFLRIAAIR